MAWCFWNLHKHTSAQVQVQGLPQPLSRRRCKDQAGREVPLWAGLSLLIFIYFTVMWDLRASILESVAGHWHAQGTGGRLPREGAIQFKGLEAKGVHRPSES